MNDSLEGWTPVHLRETAAGAEVEWCRLGPERFTDSFFEQTVTRALRDPARLVFRRTTPVDALDSFADAAEALPPAGFIFHWSRCGSTLVAQMLAALDEHVVLSEAPPIDQVLLAAARDPRLSRDARVRRIRGVIGALGQRRHPGERAVWVKFDSWHVLELPLLLTAFPEVPWIFLYRDPVEILVSQQRMRGTQLIPGVLEPGRFGLAADALQRMTIDEYGARVLAALGEAVLAQAGAGRGRLVNFEELPEALGGTLARHFRVEWTPEQLGRLREAAGRNAKTPQLSHVDDRAGKQSEASAELRRVAGEILGAVYRRLETRRRSQPTDPAG